MGSEDWKEYKDFGSKKTLRSKKQSILMKLNKGVLIELEKNGYIEREYVGRYNKIIITDTGKYIACISGLTKS